MKRDITDKLYSIAIKRYSKEAPDVNLTSDDMTAIWFAIDGVLKRDGEEKALEYVKTAQLKHIKNK